MRTKGVPDLNRRAVRGGSTRSAVVLSEQRIGRPERPFDQISG
ncbi:MAG TPA: hypothetical protein VN663_11380 [Ramlibacter sp.]|nr:hypothetical protein [Ramlibacter sp.]